MCGSPVSTLTYISYPIRLSRFELVGRIRSRQVPAGSGGVAYGTGVPWNEYGSTVIRSDECGDFVGNYPNPNPLFISHAYSVLWYVTGERYGWWRMDKYANNALGTGFPYQAHIASQMPPTVAPPSDNSAFSEGLAKTNPNTPVVDLPVALNELREIPAMLRGWGQVLLNRYTTVRGVGRNLIELPRASAKTYLEWEFGIRPFLNDLGNVLNFQKAVDYKLNAIDRLGQPNRQASGATVYQDESRSPVYEDYATPLYQEQRRVRHENVCQRKKWVTTKWKPLVPLPQTDYEKQVLAKRLAYGEDITFHTLWSAFPWTWLIDWFSNLGDLISLSRGTIPVEYGDSCLMTHLTLRDQTVGLILGPNDTLSLTYPPFHYEEKHRAVLGSVLPQVEFNLPILNGRQTAILQSLLVLKTGLGQL